MSLENLIPKNNDPSIQRDKALSLALYEQIYPNDITLQADHESSKSIPKQQRSLKSRLFSPLESGSLRGSIFALLATAIGSGVLALPLVPSRIGLIPAILMVILGAVIASSTLHFLVKSSEINHLDYVHLVQEKLGNFQAKLLQFMILIYSIGTIISYQIISFLVQKYQTQFGMPQTNCSQQMKKKISGNIGLYRLYYKPQQFLLQLLKRIYQAQDILVFSRF